MQTNHKASSPPLHPQTSSRTPSSALLAPFGFDQIKVEEETKEPREDCGEKVQIEGEIAYEASFEEVDIGDSDLSLSSFYSDDDLDDSYLEGESTNIVQYDTHELKPLSEQEQLENASRLRDASYNRYKGKKVMDKQNANTNLNSKDNGNENGVVKLRRRSHKNRKIRTTITREKLERMNKIFAEYTKTKAEGRNPHQNLKEIGITLGLGYSTILHKFRQYRSKRVVKGGALIQSLQKKRKYKKSLVVEDIIERSLASQPFYTAVQLSNYINQNFGRKFSRSIISRHLGQMGYSYKNLKNAPIQKTKPKFRQTRKVYCNIAYQDLSSKTKNILFVDQLACNSTVFHKRRVNGSQREVDSPGDYASVIVGATIDGVVAYEVKRGFYTRQNFADFVDICSTNVIVKKYGKYGHIPPKSIVLVTDLNRIHYDPFVVREGDEQGRVVADVIRTFDIQRLFLPPSSPDLNPIESLFLNLKNKLSKADIRCTEDLLGKMEMFMAELSKESVEVYFQSALREVQKVRREDGVQLEKEDKNEQNYSLELKEERGESGEMEGERSGIKSEEMNAESSLQLENSDMSGVGHQNSE